jgi:intracellular multiplication protein IcmK
MRLKLQSAGEYMVAGAIGVAISVGGAVGAQQWGSASTPPAPQVQMQPVQTAQIKTSDPDQAAAPASTPEPESLPTNTIPPPQSQSLSAMPPLPLSPPPQSGLGYSEDETQPFVVYPHADELREKVVSDIEHRQFTPEQQARIKQVYLNRQEARNSPYVNLPNPVTRTLPVRLEPGVPPAVLRLARGQLTSVVFSDSSGNPWIIENVGLNRTLFSDGEKEKEKSKPTNILTLEPLAPMAYGNISVTLRGLATPVIFILTSGQQDVDMRVDAKIPGRNPDAVAKIEVTGMPAIDDDLGYFLDGVPPKAAKRLKVSGLQGSEAWLYKNKMYLRTDGDALYPAYLARARSTSGVSIFRFESKHHNVTVTVNGQAITLNIEG